MYIHDFLCILIRSSGKSIFALKMLPQFCTYFSALICLVLKMLIVLYKLELVLHDFKLDK